MQRQRPTRTPTVPLSYPFADLPSRGGVVHVTLLHDPVIEGVEMALYIDGSAK